MNSLPSASTANTFQNIFGLVQGVGSLIGAKEENDLGSANAQVMEQRAQAERTSFGLYETQQRKLIKSKIGEQVAQTGSSGFSFSGDPITIMQESLANAEFDLSIEKYNSEVRARGFQTEADLQRYEAKQRARREYGKAAGSFLEVAANSYQSNAGSRGTKLGAGTTTNGIKVPSRYIPPR